MGRSTRETLVTLWNCTSSPSSSQLQSQFTPRSIQSERSRSSFPSQQTVKKSKLAMLLASTRSPSTCALCKQIEELLSAVPARYSETLETSFMKPLGELNALEQRLLSQTKVCEESRHKLMRSPGTDVAEQRLRESEAAYRRHIERLAAKDRCRAVRAAETLQLSGQETILLSELALIKEERMQTLKHKRAARELTRLSAETVHAQLVKLHAQIEDKRAMQAHLQSLMPAARRVYEEQLTLRRRVERLRR